MKLKKLAVNLAIIPALVGLGIAGLNLQAEEEIKTIEVHVEQENDKDAHIQLKLNGNEEVFKLADLANGESRSIVTESGKTIIASKDDKGVTSINIDGEDIRLFNYSGDMGSNFNFFHADDSKLHNPLEDKIMILGGNLSDEVKAAVKATLASYNVQSDVVFPDNSNTNMMFITKDVINSDGHDIDLETLEGKRIKIIKEVEKK